MKLGMVHVWCVGTYLECRPQLGQSLKGVKIKVKGQIWPKYYVSVSNNKLKLDRSMKLGMFHRWCVGTYLECRPQLGKSQKGVKIKVKGQIWPKYYITASNKRLKLDRSMRLGIVHVWCVRTYLICRPQLGQGHKGVNIQVKGQSWQLST